MARERNKNSVRIALASAVMLGVAAAGKAAPTPPNLVYHLDAADPLENGGTSLPSDGAALATWFNLAPGSLLPDQTKATLSTNTPTWHATAGANSTPAIRLNPSATAYYSGATASGFNFLHNGGNSTVFVVSRTDSANPATFMAVLDTGNANTGGDIGYTVSYHDQSPRNNTFFAGISNGTDWIVRSDDPLLTPDNVTNLGTWESISITYDNPAGPPQMRLFVNGNQVGAANESAQIHTGANGDAGGLFIGAAWQNNLVFNGWISELLIYDRVLTLNEIRNVNQYMKDKYNFNITNVPEPTSAALLLTAVCLATRRRAR